MSFQHLFTDSILKLWLLFRNDASIELWNLSGIPYMTHVIPGTPSGSVEAMCWVDRRLFSTGLSGAVVEWDLHTLNPKQSVLVTGQSAWCIDVTSSSNKMAVGTEQGYLNLYSLDGEVMNFERIFDKQEGRILCCKFDPSGEVLVTGKIYFKSIIIQHPSFLLLSTYHHFTHSAPF